MLPEPLRQYLTSKGLTGTDVPKIIAAWAGMKYATKGALILLSIRYQPLSYLFRRAYSPLRERARKRLAKELERTKEHDTGYARQVRLVQGRRESLAAWRGHMRRRMDRLREGPGWYERIGSLYRKQAATKSEYIAKSQAFGFFARLLALEPRALAIGAAEGMMLGVILAPLYYPVYFYLVVRYYQLRGAEPHDDAMRDLAELGGWGADFDDLESEWIAQAEWRWLAQDE